ncbi:FMN-binding glutamate synthase family protein [Sulfurirhabdus autotrophica]|uniref:Glutamate synthase domain-containing protein 2 n=1 Tax=Sulfurirhabdus autotrophica TaxID=1706046 RepID=A0A4R3YDZ8_9PROT|nr:FMN-binding glutamate synthase family protein [Sulfurirhabdus autotrophica]TCV90367.1 glutamate synthase domain-containing protein 2 [Sulfurirhabdus autotrophica]
MLSIISYGVGTIIGFLLIALLVFWIIQDITQKKHAVLRNYPVIGRLRYFFERQGEFFRQYFFSGDRDEMPFNRATRNWVYRTAKGLGGNIGFGSTNDLREPGSIIFVNAAFPVLAEDSLTIPPLVIGEGYCNKPFVARSIVNISGMSFGAISGPAVQALSKGAAEAGCWLNTGEGGLSPYHQAGNCDLIMQIGTAKYGIRDRDGKFSREKARELGEIVNAFEIKLSQGAKPGKGGVLPGIKVTTEIAKIRGIDAFVDSLSPNRHRDIANVDELLDQVALIRELSGRPVGIKTAIGGWQFINDVCDAILRRGLEFAPDYISVDGGEGGSGAAPQVLADHMSLPIAEALPRAVDALIESGLKERIKVVAAGKMVTPAKAAWALCIGADFVNTARGFMFSLGCIQAMRCHTNMCPTGITTHNKRLQRGLVVQEKYLRVANYAQNMNNEIEMIAHSCGLHHAREFRREHVRIVQTAGQSIAMNMLYPYPELKVSS